MYTRLLSALITLGKQRADLENDGHVSDSEWKGIFSEVVGELHEMADEAGMRLFETEATITATGASSYTLPTDHLSTIRIARVDTSGRRYPPLREVQVQEPGTSLYGQTGEARHFAIVAQAIYLYPNPSSGSYVHVYVPQPADLATADDTTVVNVISPSGLAFVTAAAAAVALTKSETDTRPYLAAREEARERVRTWISGRMLVGSRRQLPDRDCDQGEPGDYRWSPP